MSGPGRVSQDRFGGLLGDSRGMSPAQDADRDRATLIADRATLIDRVCAAAARVAVCDIPGDGDRLTLACEAYDLDLDPDTLTGCERARVLGAWSAAL